MMNGSTLVTVAMIVVMVVMMSGMVVGARRTLVLSA
jgi:hypothetical protein